MSSGILVIAGVDRFLAIRFPFQHKRVSKGMILKACFGYALVAGLMAIVCPIWWINLPSLRNCYFSYYLPVGLQIGLQLYINLVVNGLIGCTVTLILNSYLAYILRMASKNRAELGGGLSRNEQKAVVTLLITALINVVSCLPKSLVYLIASGLFYFVPNPTKFENQLARLMLAVGEILNTLYYLNCAINWIPVTVNYKLFGKQKKSITSTTSNKEHRSVWWQIQTLMRTNDGMQYIPNICLCCWCARNTESWIKCDKILNCTLHALTS